MGLAEIAAIATTAVISVVNQTLGGALQEVGTQIVQFLQSRFNDTLTIEQAKKEPNDLKAAIVSEANKDPGFKDALEKLVINYEGLQKSQAQVNQNAIAGSVNINVPNNSGSVTGIDQRTQSFR